MFENLLKFFVNSVFELSLFSSFRACTFKTIILTPATSQNYIWHPITNKLYSLNCWYCSVVYKNSVLNWWFSFLFHKKKNINLCSYSVLLASPKSCTPTRSNLYHVNSLATVINEPDPYGLFSCHVPNPISLFNSMPNDQSRPEVQVSFRNQAIFRVRICCHLARPPKLGDHRLSAFGDCMFNVFAATLHTGGRSSNRNLTCHDVVTRTHSQITRCFKGKLCNTTCTVFFDR
jgi:hypothetical protein